MSISIFDYSSPEAMKKLCIDLNFPPEVTDKLVSHIGNMDLAQFEPYFKGLFSLHSGAEAVKKIPELSKKEDDPTGDTGFKALAVYLAAAQHIHGMYADLGINDKVYLDTMGDFKLFINGHMESFGHYGFDRDFWIYRQLSAHIFRLGTLEFELYTLRHPVGNISGGSPVLFVHIPSDAVLTREALDASYRMVREFFSEHFPDYLYQCVYCSTWLLSPVLKQILKPGSRILEFQSDYVITHIDIESNSGIRWIFKKEYEDFLQLPEDTSLM